MLYYEHSDIQLYLGDSADILPSLPPVDLIVTWPPYDGIRSFGGHEWDFGRIAPVIADSLAEGGVMCWHTNDMVVNGGYTNSSLKAAIAFCDDYGLTMHDRIIVVKEWLGSMAQNRWHNNWDYVWVFSKGKPRVFNPIRDRKNMNAGNRVSNHRGAGGVRGVDGIAPGTDSVYTIPDYGKRFGIWHIYAGGAPPAGIEHPARMPDQLAQDLIRAYSNPGDLVLDPFSGSATTPYSALLLGRRGIGVEIHEPYIREAVEKRFRQVPLIGAE